VDNIREYHGVACITVEDKLSKVSIWESADGRGIIINHGDLRNRRLTSEDARYLASKLNRLARRIEERKDGEVS
jgi:hypothetical protein